MLVERVLSDRISGFIQSGVLDDGGRVEHLLRELWKLGNQEEDGNSDSGACDGKVDELDVDQVARILACKEELGSDQRANEGGNTIP